MVTSSVFVGDPPDRATAGYALPAARYPFRPVTIWRVSIRDIPLTTIDGETTTLADYADQVILVVNVASRCGLSPQYEQLEELQESYHDRGFTVLGFPSNQFFQELGTEEAIKDYCSTTWGITFPLFARVKVNGKSGHPLYQELTKTPDSDGKAGRIQWNFEKFLVTPDDRIQRFRPRTTPDSPEIVSAIEAALP
jgi:glutathione peroxidase